ncbi:PD-(D/E)XK motif protein [Streptomyces sp. NPDC048603]|uniref:PD-(D/E)XK motif protein n=1 Tax=Streptomyces sp. NPDC048603 TaxID=3365577 RepID=UPI003723EE9B
MTEPRLPWSTVEYYLGLRQAASYRLSAPTAERTVSYEIDDDGRGIALHVELGHNRQPPRSPVPAVAIDQVAHRGMRMARVRTTQVELMRDFHDLLMAVADRIVSGERELGQALDETLDAWAGLLSRPRGLGAQRRIGLHGELAVLLSVARTHGWEGAVTSWTGSRSEQHDFGLPDSDVEVKTTSCEDRRHTVHGIGQLEETNGRPLWLASLQLTRGGTGGRSLQESVASVVRDARAASRIAGARLEEALGRTGWSPTEPDDERWTLRSDPLLVPADRLPRLTRAMLPPDVRDHVLSIDYDIRLNHLGPVPGAPVDLTDFRLP